MDEQRNCTKITETHRYIAKERATCERQQTTPNKAKTRGKDARRYYKIRIVIIIE